MKFARFLVLLILPLTLLLSCSKDFSINDDWKEIMIVYGLLDPNDTIQYVKITKAFLGPGNALNYAQIPDSSSLAGKIRVRLDEYSGSTILNTIYLDTTTITNKDSGIFYFPNQLVYYTTAQLNKEHLYKITITDTVTGVEVTSSTNLVNNFAIESPNSFAKANFVQGSLTTTKWMSALYGRRYQLNIRFSYWEYPNGNTSAMVKKSVDWEIFTDIKSKSLDGGEEMEYSFFGDGFYSSVKAQVPYDPSMTRIADSVEYFFSVASEELSNYIEVTNPSNTIVQEKPIYTNIENGIGIFSSRTGNATFSPRKLRLSDRCYDSLYNGVVTGNLF